jgi:hypothetical protein
LTNPAAAGLSGSPSARPPFSWRPDSGTSDP